jgi:hypothetical protein
MGWSGPGSFMVSPFGQPLVIMRHNQSGFALIGSGI